MKSIGKSDLLLTKQVDEFLTVFQDCEASHLAEALGGGIPREGSAIHRNVDQPKKATSITQHQLFTLVFLRNQPSTYRHTA